MKKNLLFCLFCILVSTSLRVNAQNPLTVKNVEKVNGFQFSLDLANLKNILVNAPVLNTTITTKSQALLNGITFQMPMPDGKYKTFKLIEAPILSAQLAKEYPDIKTYRAYNVTDDSYGGRITLWSQGFSAAIHVEEGEVFIEKMEEGLYKSFFQNSSNTSFGCVVGDSFESNAPQVNNPKVFSNGSVLKTYRLAVVTTGEFFQNNGATQGAAMAALVSHVNAMDAVYEKDAGISFTLAATLIYENPATDDLNPGGYGDEAQRKFNLLNTSNPTTFGFAHYDIGHVFHYTGAGTAGADVCGTNKATGWSGVEPTYRVLLYHEVGHQFGAAHSFNSVASGCFNNRAATAAVEPGSGSTIMSYQGNCTPDNLSNFNPITGYFHTFSLEQIFTFCTTNATCFASTASGNTPPVVLANPSGNPITIPKGTPFTLQGSGTDANGETISYNWEQVDIGTTTGGAAAAAGSTDSPIFRSFTPSITGNIRTFPNFSTILNNGVANNEEALPTVARTLKMQLTGRDNNGTSGGTNSSLVSITVSNNGPFQITSHGSSATIAGGTAITVTWNVNGTNAHSANVKISMSVDGDRFPIILSASTPNDGSQGVTIPAWFPNTTTARIKVSSLGTANYEWFDINNADLTITSFCSPKQTMICPVNTVTAVSGNAALNLGLNISSASKLTGPKTYATTGLTNYPVINYTNNTYTVCQASGFTSVGAVLVPFRVTKTGSYTISFDGNGYDAFSIFSSPAPFSCANFVGGNTHSSIGNDGNSRAIPLTECTTYYALLYNINNTNTSIIFNVEGAGEVYLLTPPHPANFNYTYAAINQATSTIVMFSATSDFTTLAAGTYSIFGVSYVNSIVLTGFIGHAIQTIENSGNCVLFGSNSKTLIVTASSCPQTLTFTNPANNISTGTVVQKANQTITATNRITGGNVTYQAGNNILMNPGFQVSGGAVYRTIRLAGCN